MAGSASYRRKLREKKQAEQRAQRRRLKADKKPSSDVAAFLARGTTARFAR